MSFLIQTKRTMIKNNLKNAIVHFSNQDSLIQSTGRFITIYKHSSKLKTIINLPFCFPRDLHFNIPLLKRLLRSDAKEVIYDKLNDKLVIIRDTSVYLIQESTYILLGNIEGDAPLFN